MILRFRTDRYGQTVQTCHSVCTFWTHYCTGKPPRVITAIFTVVYSLPGSLAACIEVSVGNKLRKFISFVKMSTVFEMFISEAQMNGQSDLII